MSNKESSTIAIFAAHYPPCPGGIAKFMGVTVRALADKGYKVIVVTSDFDNPISDHSNVTVIKLPYYKKIFGSSRYPIIRKDKHFKDSLAKLKSLKIDRVIALTRFHSTSHVAANFARKNKIPLYLLECGANPLTVNNKWIDIGIHFVEWLLTKRIEGSVYKWGAMSQAGTDFLKKRYGLVGEFVWPCSIQVPERVTKTNDESMVTITYSGRIENLKGEDELAASFTNLVATYPNIRLNFLGDGSYLPILKKNYTHPHIRYWGNVAPDEVSRVNLDTDIFVCATRFPDGAVPNAVLEAGVARCAGVTSPNGGFTDLMIHEQNGLLTKPDLSDMQECIERLILDKSLRGRLSNALFEDIKKKYRPEQIADTIIDDLELKQREGQQW